MVDRLLDMNASSCRFLFAIAQPITPGILEPRLNDEVDIRTACNVTFGENIGSRRRDMDPKDLTITHVPVYSDH